MVYIPGVKNPDKDIVQKHIPSTSNIPDQSETSIPDQSETSLPGDKGDPNEKEAYVGQSNPVLRSDRVLSQKSSMNEAAEKAMDKVPKPSNLKQKSVRKERFNQ